MKKTNIFFWITTLAFSVMMVGSAIPSIRVTQESIDFMSKGLGYPVYFIPFTGVAKVLGIIAILIPGYPRIKEWAYAGLIFDLVGAIYSIIAIGQEGWSFILIPLGLGIASYLLYHRRLAMKRAGATEQSKIDRLATTA